MSAHLSVSSQFDDPAQIAEDLVKAIPDFSPADSLAFLFCDSQVDHAEVVSELRQKLNVSFVGGTSITFPMSNENETAANLLLFSKQGMRFAIAVSEMLDASKMKEQMQDVLRQCLDALGEKPRVLVPFFPLMPGFPTGSFIGELLKLAEDIPVFGGTTTGDLISTHAAVFADGKSYTDRMILVALGGSVRPVFAVDNVVTPMAPHMPTVTRSAGNIVYRVDDLTFCDYMKKLGLSPEDRVNGVDALLQYGPIPVRLDLEGQPCDGIPEISCISYTTLDDESATFPRAVPEGTRLGVSILEKKDIEKSAQNCLEKILAETAAEERNGYEYDTLLCVSCVARYFILVGDENREALILKQMIPENFSSSAFYGFSEICPTKDRQDNHFINRAHSASIIMCAL